MRMTSKKGFGVTLQILAVLDCLSVLLLEQNIYSRFEFVNMKRFGEMVIGARTECDHLAVFIVERCNDDDGGAHEVEICPQHPT